MAKDKSGLKLGGIYKVYCRDLAVAGEGICVIAEADQEKADSGLPLMFVPGLLPGETAEVVFLGKKKGLYCGQIKRCLTGSKERVTAACPVFQLCGGCSLQHLSYEGQLRHKQQQVASVLQRLGGLSEAEAKHLVRPTLASPEIFYYRNYARYICRFDEATQALRSGFFAAQSHHLIENEMCLLQSGAAEAIRAYVHQTVGLVPDLLKRLTQLLVRSFEASGECVVALVCDRHLPLQALPDRLIHGFREAAASAGFRLVSIWLNKAMPDVTVLGPQWQLMWGRAEAEARVSGLRYLVGPRSFFQVNSRQTEHLYAQTVALSGAAEGRYIADLYCGSGTISLALAKAGATVVGVEIVPEAIHNAKINARLNDLEERSRFYSGAAETVLPRLVEDGHHFDAIVVDPPRKGCAASLLELMLKLAPERIVYVSCNPSTLARDLKLLCVSGRYAVQLVQPIDMFPQTGSIETVCLLSNRKPDTKVKIDLDLEDYYRIKDEQKKNKASE